jgi:hypothetical protein
MCLNDGISRDFGWGLVLANDKWNLQVGVE